MPVELLNIGYNNVVVVGRIVAVLSPRSSKDSKVGFSEPMKRLRDSAKEHLKLIDATAGRRTRSIIVTDSDHVILSAIESETIAQRLQTNKVGLAAKASDEGSRSRHG